MKKTAVAALHSYIYWVRQLPRATGTLFAARTKPGRWLKTFLFGVGVVLPLGSLIWVLLFLHGTRVGGHSNSRLSVQRTAA